MIDHKNNYTTYHIKGSHKRHQFFTYICNTLDATKDYKCCQNSNHNSHNPWLNIKIIIAHFRNGIYLRRTSDSKRGKPGKNREEHSQPFHIQPAFQSVHSSALHTPVSRLDTIFYSNK